MFQRTTATDKIQAMNKRIRAIAGGTSASKTISILLCLIHLAQTDKKPTLTSIVAESIPHLKRGAMRDFKIILTEHNYWKDACWNATDSIYTFETGSKIEFFSTDNGDKNLDIKTDGKPFPILDYAISKNNSDGQNNGDEEKDQSDSGGNISEQDNINPAVLDTPSPERQETNPN
jgi:hypothetical protein